MQAGQTLLETPLLIDQLQMRLGLVATDAPPAAAAQAARILGNLAPDPKFVDTLEQHALLDPLHCHWPSPDLLHIFSHLGLCRNGASALLKLRATAFGLLADG